MAKRKTASPETVSAREEPRAEYQVLARRYRPQHFSDLVGQEPVSQALSNALQTGRVAHAYLFTGARGVGKTSTARILAKCLNCFKGPTVTPCDQCEMCQAIASGEDTDVLEIDGASNRGIDEVREIRANVQYRPSRARYKIYIIDEVHMLTGPAFNALLKTLEEPPPHVKFIFATTEVNKIPITILSRCQRFDFAGIGMSPIIERLRAILRSEGREAEDAALTVVARRAGGSMRDAQSLLDQLLAFSPATLSVNQVYQLLGSAGEERIAALAQALLKKDAPGALNLLNQALDQGGQFGELLDQLIEYWRDLMVTQVAGVDRIGISVTGEHKKDLEFQAMQYSLDTLLAGLDVLTAARQRLRMTSYGRVLLEMAVVRLCRLENLVPLAQLTEFLSREAPPSPRPMASAPAPFPGPTQLSEPPVSAEKKKNLSVFDPQKPAPPRDLTEENLQAIWNQVLSQSAFILQSQLKKISSVAIFGPNTLVLRFPPGYNLQEENLLDPGRLNQVERILEKVLAKPCSIRQEILAEGNSGGGAAATGPAPVPQRQRNDLKAIPLIGKAMEVMEARVVSEDPDFGTLPTERPNPTPDNDEG